MTAWLTSLRDRPIAARERRTALAVFAVLLAASAVLLAATRPAWQHDPAQRQLGASAGSASRPPAPASRAANTTRVAPVLARVAHGFLAGYLAYLYGHAPARAVRDAAPALLRSLRAHPPLVSPATRARHPRVLSLHPAPAPVGRIGVSALVGDGELASYPVRLLLTSEDGRLLVSAVEGT